MRRFYKYHNKKLFCKSTEPKKRTDSKKYARYNHKSKKRPLNKRNKIFTKIKIKYYDKKNGFSKIPS